MSYEVRCSCGELLRGRTGERLLAAVERHAEVHPQPTWRRGPSLRDLREQVAALGARVELLERRGGSS